MSHATFSTPFAPALDPATAAAIRRAAAATVRATAFTAASIAAAALVWLVLAGPGFLSDHASTTAARHAAHR